MHYRHEIKHEISYGDMLALRQRLASVARPDPHAVGGRYQVRSLYFDNWADKALREKIDGVNRREKFRLRYYNGDPCLINLEKKCKINGLCTKESAPLSQGQAQALASGRLDWMPQTKTPLVLELYSKMKSQGLIPKTLVDYTREAYLFAPGNVRVTLDYHIRTGLLSTDFLNPDCVTIPAGEAGAILEVKWDTFLPDIIQDVIQLQGRRAGAFSKYAACRRYG